MGRWKATADRLPTDARVDDGPRLGPWGSRPRADDTNEGRLDATNEHPNAALARRAFEAFDTGDHDVLADGLDEDAVWHYIGGDEPIPGRSAVLDFMARFDITFSVHDVVANDEHVVALLDATATRDGQTLR